jgi:opacity protein-like surface antigen
LKRPALCLTRALCKTARPLLAGGVAFTCFAAPAFAADLSPREAPPVFSWSGLYVGFNSGYSWRGSSTFSTAAVNLFDSPAIPGLPGSQESSPTCGGAASARGATGSVGTRLNGFFSGGQVGYNWQFSDRFVAGLEADLQGAGIRGGGGFTNLTPAAVYPPFIAATSVTVNRSLEYFGTVRGRLGYAVSPTLLFYATGGLAYGGIATSTAVNQSLTPSLLLSSGAKSDFFNTAPAGRSAAASNRR